MTELETAAAEYALFDKIAENFPGKIMCSAFKAGAEWALKKTLEVKCTPTKHVCMCGVNTTISCEQNPIYLSGRMGT